MPVDRSAIDAQLRAIGEGDRWWEHREFRALPHILHADERILGVVRGKLLGVRRPRIGPAGAWLFVSTTQRLICLKQDRFARKQVEFAAGQITRVQQGSRLRAYQIALDTPQWRYRIRITKEDAFRFAGSIAGLVPGQPRMMEGTLEPKPMHPAIAAVAGLPGVDASRRRRGSFRRPSPPPVPTSTGWRQPWSACRWTWSGCSSRWGS
ncbi:MAG TPA: PH domain-containing protein, partial [Longimicrobium sp.]